MFLGLEQQTGLVYEGSDGPTRPIVPFPIVTQAKLIKSEGDWNDLTLGLPDSPTSWVFREDTFDPVARTRRGRLYESQPTQPTTHRVVPHPHEDPSGRSAGAGGRTSKKLFVYKSCRALLSEPHQGKGLKIALGTRSAASAWRIIQAEVVANGDVMVTLKALSAFGILPEINLAKISENFRKPVQQAMDRALDSAFRETPVSVIDQCRNALTVILSRWLVDQGHDQSILREDLGRVVDAISKAPYERGCVGLVGKLVARLHSRGKGNEVHARSLRDPVEEDAELALHVLGFAIRDIDWAEP